VALARRPSGTFLEGLPAPYLPAGGAPPGLFPGAGVKPTSPVLLHVLPS